MSAWVNARVSVSFALRSLRVLGHMHRIRYGIRNRILYAVFDPAKPRDMEFQVELAGQTGAEPGLESWEATNLMTVATLRTISIGSFSSSGPTNITF